MQSLDFSTMENVQGGVSGSVTISLTGLLTALSSLLGIGGALSLGISYALDISDLTGLVGGLGGLV